MWPDREANLWRWLLVLAGVLAGLGLAVSVEGGGTAKSRGGHAVVTYLPAETTRAAPDVRDTPANLQSAFANEINAKERYVSFMKQAAADGYPAVARLFRACADAESIHARRLVAAIAVTGGSARAVLERLQAGSTEQNVRTALDAERWEAERYYPALLERSRAEHWPMAARAFTSALATEREHVRLLDAALTSLDQRPVAGAIYVCSFCGRTVEQPESGHCPQCFTSARRFIEVP